MIRRIGVAFAALLLLAGAAPLAEAGYMSAKARLGTWLLERSWHTGLEPWPGADLQPLARIEFPALGHKVVALDSASGKAMAWGPGHVQGTAAPGTEGLTAFAAHRDSHFAFLAHLAPGDAVWVETRDGIRQRYRVRNGLVVDARHWRFPTREHGKSLALSTCWPLDAHEQGHKRLVIFADAETETNT